MNSDNCDNCDRKMSILEKVGYCVRCDKNNLCIDCCVRVKVSHYFLEDATVLENFCIDCGNKINLIYKLGSEKNNEAVRKTLCFKPKRISVKKTKGQRFYQDNIRFDFQYYEDRRKRKEARLR